MTTPTNEQFLTPPEVAKKVHRDLSAVYRWILRGVAIGGRVVKLSATRGPDGWKIAESDIKAFFDTCNAAGHAPRPRAKPARIAVRPHEQAAASLEALGVK